jgi:hypothetical protein
MRPIRTESSHRLKEQCLLRLCADTAPQVLGNQQSLLTFKAIGLPILHTSFNFCKAESICESVPLEAGLTLRQSISLKGGETAIEEETAQLHGFYVFNVGLVGGGEVADRQQVACLMVVGKALTDAYE